MFRRMDDFLSSYKQLTDSTSRMFAELTDANLDQAVAEGYRTLGQIAWHVVVTVPEMMNRTGLGLSGVSFESPPPATAAEIQSAYETVAGELRAALESAWTDATLAETDDLYGQKWQRGFTLTALIQHEIHHRGQMSVLLRQAGRRVPGVFGPAKEEWKQFGMKEPPY